MAGPASIVVRRLLLDVDMQGTEQDALAVQRWLPGLCADVLVPAIEAALRHVDPGVTALVLDRFAVEVELPELAGLAAAFPAAARRAVAEQIGPALLTTEGPPDRDAEHVRWRSPADAADEALLVFLRTGRLPWSFPVPAGARLEDLVRAARPAPAPGARERLRAELTAPHVRDRTLKQFSPAFVTLLLHSLSPGHAVAVEEALRRLGATGGSPRPVLAAALAAVAEDQPLGTSALLRTTEAVPDPEPTPEPEPEPYPKSKPEPAADPKHVQVSGDGVGGGAEPIITAARGRRGNGADQRGPVRGGEGELGPVGVPEPAAALEGSRSGTAERRAEVPLLQRPEPAPIPEPEPEPGGVLVDHAGVVLLHPFLPRFLTGLGVADGDALLDPDRAVCLIHHLATGEPTAPEHRVTLAKVLCGLPLGQPVEADVGLTDADTEEATALLDAAIGHWAALRSTSPDGLRAEFLMRPGTLTVDVDGDWLLRVETRTSDVLLDQLPWGTSMVRLPWMQHVLRVEWR